MAKKTWGHTAISNKTGEPIYGIAAMLQNMSDAGWPDAYHSQLANTAGRAGGLAMFEEMTGQKRSKKHTKLKAVSWFYHWNF